MPRSFRNRPYAVASQSRRLRQGQLAFYLLTALNPVVFSIPFLVGPPEPPPTPKQQPRKRPSSVKPAPPKLAPGPKPQPNYNPVYEPPDVHKTFVDVLVAAGKCDGHRHGHRGRCFQGRFTQQETSKRAFAEQRRQIHSVPAIRRLNRNRSPLSVDECLRIVDFYSTEFSTLSPRPNNQASPTLFGLEERFPLARYAAPMRTEANASGHSIAHQGAVDEVRAILHERTCTHEEAWKAYKTLPDPGLKLLSDTSKHLLLQRLAVTQKKNQVSMFRYLSVMDEMISMGYTLDKSAWSTAVAFTGHGYSRITSASVEAALLKWKEMEHKADVTSGHVTFNILFNLATKADKLSLAEMIFKEMESRGLRLSRFGRVGLIYYHGMRGDGDGVRNAYKEFVEAGEIVDTVVVNCVIASLVRAGELSAAEHVFERMKQILHQHTGRQIPNLDWREPRDLGRVLNASARRCKDDPTGRQTLQEQQFLAPSQQTFAIFVEHHATKTGEIRRIASLINEMQHFGVPMEGRIFVRIFKGFAYHGGIQYTAWTKARLNSVWDALIRALDQKLDHVSLDRWLVVWIMRAFKKCFGAEQTLQTWEELRRRWKGDYRELGTVQDMLKDILSDAVRDVRAAGEGTNVHL